MKKSLWSVVILVLSVFLFGCEEDDKSYLLSEYFKEEITYYNNELEKIYDEYKEYRLSNKSHRIHIYNSVNDYIEKAIEFRQIQFPIENEYDEEVYESMKWYVDTIVINMEQVLLMLNSVQVSEKSITLEHEKHMQALQDWLSIKKEYGIN